MNLFALSVELGMDTSEFERGISQAKTKTAASVTEMKSQYKSLAASLGGYQSAFNKAAAQYGTSSQSAQKYSARIIYNRAMPGGLRTARHCVFTGGVVEENSICRAGFLRKQPRGGKNPLRLTAFASRSPFWLRHLPPAGGSRSTQGELFAICWSARTKLPLRGSWRGSA